MIHRPLWTLRTAATCTALIVLLVDWSFAFGLHPTRPRQTAYQTALKTSTLPNEEKTQTSNDDAENPSSSLLSLQDIQRLTEQAIEHRGTDVSYQALRTLAHACQQRVPYDFADNNTGNVHPVRQLVPLEITHQISEIVQAMEAEGCLSTNLDSVDGLPSFHLNLVSNGTPIFPKQENGADSSSTSMFEQRTQQLFDLVEPYIYNELLPQVQRLSDNMSNNKTIHSKRTMKVGDIFLRRYGQDSEDARNGISAHYDVFSKITAVIAMDNVAADGKHGLFTTALSSSSSSSSSTTGAITSNHKSLRRYFPLSEGDAVLHSWDVLHGVDVLPGMGRTSLIVWFTEETTTTCSDDDKRNDADNTTTNNIMENVSPWLLTDTERIAMDEVTQFVLASALESVNDGDDSTASMTSSYNSQELYLKSAGQQSAFALSRLGSLFETDSWKSPELKQQAKELLDAVCPVEQIPAPLRPILLTSEVQQHQDQRILILPEHQSMAWRFWLQAAWLGNPQAQLALADELMAHAATSLEGSSDEERDDVRLMAAVLFGLAAQQGEDHALERLKKVVEIETAEKQIETQEDFFNSRVVQTARAATATMQA